MDVFFVPREIPKSQRILASGRGVLAEEYEMVYFPEDDPSTGSGQGLLAAQRPQVPNGWKNSAQPQVKNQVKVGADAPAQVEWLGQDCLVRFDDRSVVAGRSFTIRRQSAIQLTLPWKFASFSPT